MRLGLGVAATGNLCRAAHALVAEAERCNRAEIALRILMISDVYSPRVNGVSTSIETFRREFEKTGHRVTLIAPEYGVSDSTVDSNVIRIASRYVFVDPEDRMMKGRPIMALTESLCAGQGALVAEEESGDFADKVLQVLKSEALRRRLSAAGLRYVKQWSARACALRLLSLYEELIA